MTAYQFEVTESFKEELNIALIAVRKASTIAAKDFFETRQLLVSQKGTVDFVSITKKKIEREIIKCLQKYRPEIGIVSEEQKLKGSALSTYNWIINPIDGLFNFMHGLPFFCISIALVESCNGKVEALLGVVHNPVTDETFFARKGQGARTGPKINNCKKITASNVIKLERMICVVDLHKVDRDLHVKKYLERILQTNSSGFRLLGSTALELAYLADSRINLAIYDDLSPWDYVAGMLIMQEAGNIAVDLQNNPIDLNKSKTSLIASNRKMLQVFASDVAAK